MGTLFTQALGVAPPWVVSTYEFSSAAGRIDFHLRCDAARLTCPACGAAEQPIHDCKERRWRHLNFIQYQGKLAKLLGRLGALLNDVLKVLGPLQDGVRE